MQWVCQLRTQNLVASSRANFMRKTGQKCSISDLYHIKVFFERLVRERRAVLYILAVIAHSRQKL